MSDLVKLAARIRDIEAVVRAIKQPDYDADATELFDPADARALKKVAGILDAVEALKQANAALKRFWRSVPQGVAQTQAFRDEADRLRSNKANALTKLLARVNP